MADDIAYLAVLSKEAVKDWAPIVALAKRAVATDRNASYLETLAAAEYRQGHFKEAIERLKESADLQGQGGSVWTQLFLAMAYRQVSNAEQVKTLYEKVLSQLKPHDGDDAKNDFGWQDKVRRRVLLKEAQQLLDPSAAEPAKK